MRISILFFLCSFLLLSFSSLAQLNYRLSGPIADDNFLTLLNPLATITNIHQIERKGLAKGQSKFEPWASSYWPIHRGILAFRYAEKAKYNSKSFMDNYDAFYARPSFDYVRDGDINSLSPAEKYDLLIGDSHWTLTNVMWNKGYIDYQEKGIVAQWTGICHGWSAIAQRDIEPPRKSVTVRDATGQFDITFNESDIKGLLSYLWAESPPETKQAGHRCYQVPIDRDQYLRPLEQSCLDTNPMTWHLAVINRLGQYGKSFVMDSSIGAEVWNYPITSYDYNYFNARTLLPTQSLNTAIIPIAELSNDRFAALRHPDTRYVVGIIMDVFHPALIEPSTSSGGNNVYQTHTFIYDLELNANYDIVGGEWYSEDQPDFLWTFPDDSQARVREDTAEYEPWDTSLPLPSTLATAAQGATQRGKVMATIINKLHTKSLE